MLLNLGFQIGGIAVFVDDDFGPGESGAVDDGGVIQAIGENDVALARQRRQRSLIGIETALHE